MPLGIGPCLAGIRCMRFQLNYMFILGILSAILWHSVASSHALSSGENVISVFGETLSWRKIEGLDYHKKNLGNGLIFLSVHSTNYWDQEGLISDAREEISVFARQNNFPFYYLVSQEEKGSATALQVKQALPFEGDAHFYKANNIVVFVGGNFTQCLCNAIRSTIIHADKFPLKLKLISDGIYEIPFPSNLTDADRRALRPQGQDRNKLSDLVSYMTDESLLDYLKNDWLSRDGLPCPLYQPSFLREEAGNAYLFKVMRDGNRVGEIGIPGANVIELDFLTLDQFLH